MQKYLIAIDIDGTLRHNDGTISDFSKKVLKETKEQGHFVILTTARPRYHAKEVNKEINGSNEIICLNGAEIYDTNSDKVIHETFISNEEAIILYEYAKRNNIKVVFNIDSLEYVTKYRKNGNQILLTKNKEKIIEQSKIKEFMAIGEKEKIKEFRKIMISKYNMNIFLNIDEKNYSYFVLISDLASKGAGVKFLAEYLKIAKEYIIAFGNDNNDISMFKASSTGVAVANATSELKEIASSITASNNADGVAKYLVKNILK